VSEGNEGPSRELVTGGSVATWSNVVYLAFCANLLTGVLAIVFMPRESTHPQEGQVLPYLVPLLVAIVLLLVGIVGTAIQESRETSAGNTTSLRRHLDLVQGDRRTGVVIRGAGEPALDRSERLRRSAEARSRHPRRPPAVTAAGPSAPPPDVLPGPGRGGDDECVV
jgi:hypothetical protein